VTDASEIHKGSLLAETQAWKIQKIHAYLRAFLKLPSKKDRNSPKIALDFEFFN
jgi:hypothetical protein